MDSAAAGEKPSAGKTNINDMKTILESIQSVQECGMEEGPMDMPSEPEDKMSMNVTMSARGDAVEDLIKLIGGATTPQDAPTSMPMPMPKQLPAPDTHDDEMGDMKKMMKIASDGPGDSVLDVDIDGDHQPDIALMPEEGVEEEWDNSPEEEYSDTKTMTKDLSGGINREKKAYRATQDGDNPMAVEASIKEQLWAALNEKFTEGRGAKPRGKKPKKEEIEATEGRGAKPRGKKPKK